MIDLNKKTAFIIGNGGSRAKFDLNLLTPHGTTYGCNALYRDFYPDWLVAIDDGMIAEIRNNSNFPLEQFIEPSEEEKYEPIELYNAPVGTRTPRSNAGMNAMTEAIRHGHEQLVMIGFDFIVANEKIGTSNMYDGTDNYGPNTRASFQDQARRMNYLNWFIDKNWDIDFVFCYPQMEGGVTIWEFMCERDVAGMSYEELEDTLKNA